MHFLTWWNFLACFTKYDITKYDFYPEKIYWMKREQMFVANTIWKIGQPNTQQSAGLHRYNPSPYPQLYDSFSFLPSPLLITAAFTIETFRIHLYSLPC